MKLFGTNRIAAASVALFMCASLAAAWQSIQSAAIQPVQKGAAISFVSQTNFSTTRSHVWSVLTSMSGFEAVSGCTIEPADREKPFSKIGDSVAAQMWSNKGRLVVTGLDAGRELRVVFEPDQATYLFGQRFVLATAGEGSVLQYWIQYTDFQPNADETAKAAREATVKSVGAFRNLVELRGKPPEQD